MTVKSGILTLLMMGFTQATALAQTQEQIPAPRPPEAEAAPSSASTPIASAEAAGPALTVDEVVQTALSHSPNLKGSEARADEARWKKHEALSGFLPTLGVNANHLFDTRYVYTDTATKHSPNIIPSSVVALNFELPLFDGLRNVNRYRARSAGFEAARDQADWDRFKLEEEVRFLFYQSLAAEKLEAVARQNLLTITDHLNQIQQLNKGGLATHFDVLRIEVQVSEAHSELLKSQDDAVLARQKLTLAMGLPAGSETRPLSGEITVPSDQSIKDLKVAQYEARKDLSAQVSRALASDLDADAEKAHWFPRVSMRGQYQLYNNITKDVSNYDDYRAAWTLGVYLNWNLIDGFAAYSKQKQTEYQKVQSQSSLAQSELEAPVDFEFWKRRYLYSTSLYQARTAEVRQAEESVRLAKAAFKAGVRTSTEILDAELDLFRARAGLVTALVSSVEAKIKLELALGRKI